jgi:hypothetical protein
MVAGELGSGTNRQYQQNKRNLISNTPQAACDETTRKVFIV